MNSKDATLVNKGTFHVSLVLAVQVWLNHPCISAVRCTAHTPRIPFGNERAPTSSSVVSGQHFCCRIIAKLIFFQNFS